MKTTMLMSARAGRTVRQAGSWMAVLALGMAGWTLAAADDDAGEAQEEEAVEYLNWFNVGMGSTFVNQNDAAHARRSGLPEGVFGGVDEFHYEQVVAKKGAFKIDGRGLFDLHDYSLKFDLSHPDKGYLRAGYREHRSWYDGSGGFFPPSGAWFSLYDDDLKLDRSEVWVEAGLTLPAWPEFRVRYSREVRQGFKDSTVWGETQLTGGAGSRNILPSFRELDEQRHTVSADATHKLGETKFGLGVRLEFLDNHDALKTRPRATEARDRSMTQREGVEMDLFNLHGFTETRLSKKLLFTTGYAFTTLDTDLTGSRIFGVSYDAVYDPTYRVAGVTDVGFVNLTGGGQVNQHVATLNLLAMPWESLSIVPSIRLERLDSGGVSAFQETSVNTGALGDRLQAHSDWGLLDLSESLEVRYTGLTNWVFYASGLWNQGSGTQDEQLLRAGAVDIARETDLDRLTQKYTAGANWYPLRRLSLGAQYYRKIRENTYEHPLDTTSNAVASGNRYPAFLEAQDFTTDDVNLRLTWRPRLNLTWVTRYDFQRSTIDTRGANLAADRSAEVTSHILSQSLTWSPTARLYLQGGASYVRDQTDTPAHDLTGGAAGLVWDTKNHYWNVNGTAGFALSEKTDLQATYFYYKADNYEDNSFASLPYGAGAEEHGVTAGFSHQFSKRVRWNLKYGFFRSRDRTAGGYNDFDAHLVYSGIQYRF